MKSISSKRVCWILAAIFVISLIPLFILSFYNHPAIDDYYYGIKTHRAVSEAESETGLLSAAVDQVVQTYGEWQGTYSAVFLFSLQPGIFGEQWYVLSTFILLSVFIFANLFFAHVFLRKILGTSKYAGIGIALSVLLVSVQLVPSPLQSYFWWNGSIYYTFFYSLSLILFALIGIYLKSESRVSRIGCVCGGLLLAAILGGANFVTALVSCILLVALIGYLAIRKNPKAFAVAAILAVFLIGFAISIAAPGNAVRQECYPHTPNAISAILQSFYYSVCYLFEWTTVPLIVVLLILSPFISRAAAQSSWSFRYPGLFVLASFCVFTAQFTPPLYGMNSIGSDGARLLNIIYYSYFWFLIADVFYVSGYLVKKYGYNPNRVIRGMEKRKAFAMLCVVLLFVAVMPMLDNVLETRQWKGDGCAASSAVYSLVSGEAEQYDKENDDRYRILTDETVRIAEFKPFSVHPKLLFYGDLTQDPDWMWSNRPMREYFNKESVTVRWIS